MDTYLIAVKRESRDKAQDNWADALDTVEGVEAQPNPLRPDRRQVHATASGIEEIKRRLGDLCHIEPMIMHQPVTPPIKTASGEGNPSEPGKDDSDLDFVKMT